MELIEVSAAALEKDFIEVNVLLGKANPNYIRPLDKDINEVFDRKKNKAFRQGEAIRWVLKDGNGKLIGRIAAFTNKKYRNKGDEIAVGGVGFFDCINNQDAADMLLDVAKAWLIQKGMQAMDGPINFGERDRWWGLLVEGFEPPIYCMNFNPVYYKDLLENYGFKVFFNQFCFGLRVGERQQEKFYSRHAAVAANPDIRAEHIRKGNLQQFAKDFGTVYNKAWAGHGGLKQLEEKVVIKMFQSMKPVLDERINWIVYDKDQPIAAWVNLPDLNQWFKHLNGKFGLLQKLKFLWVKKTKHCDKFIGLVFGVIPEYQAKGIDSYMIVESCKIIQRITIKDDIYTLGKPIYENFEMQWIGDFNPRMINVAESIGAYKSRTLSTFRYLFDRTKEYKRHPMV